MNHFDNIPNELKEHPVWVLWKAEERDGRIAKPPYTPRGNHANVSDPYTWSTYKEVEAAYLRGKYSGLGIVLTNSLAAIDIDHCIVDGVLTDTAQQVVSMMDSYTEISPSGEGIRILFYAEPLKVDKEHHLINNQKLGLEVYLPEFTQKYVTLTGNLLNDSPVNRRTEAIRQVLDDFMKRPALISPFAVGEPVNNTVANMPDDELLQKIRASKEGEKFNALWSGDMEKYDNDHSKSDMALCGMLAFWTGRDIQRMDRLFRESALYRPKWNEDRGGLSYGARTIDKAVRECKKVYGQTYKESTMEQENNPTGMLDTITAKELQNKHIPPIVFLVDQILPQGLALLSAPPKYGKSWMALDLCLSVAMGHPFMGYTTTQASTLYLALEDSFRRLQSRMQRICKDHLAPENFSLAITADTLDNKLSEQIADHLEKRPDTKLLVIDVLERVRSAGGRNNSSAYNADYKDMSSLKKIADEHDLCVLIVHHNRKMQDVTDSYNMISGTNGIMGGADTIWVMHRDERKSSTTKLSLTGRDIEPEELIISMDKNTMRWMRVASVAEQEEHFRKGEYESDPVVETIREELSKSPKGIALSATDFLNKIKEYTGEEPDYTASSLGRHLNEIDGLLLRYDGIEHEYKKTREGRVHCFKKAGEACGSDDTCDTGDT